MNDLISKKHKISSFFSITLITIFLIAFQACNKNDESNGVNELDNLKLSYLDTDISNLTDLNLKQSTNLKSAILSEQQMTILKEARTRIDGYIVYQPAKKMYCLKVSTGSQIQMSEKLFEFFKAQMMQANAITKDLDVIQDRKDPKRLHVL